jgi:hypothetical protein
LDDILVDEQTVKALANIGIASDYFTLVFRNTASGMGVYKFDWERFAKDHR